MCGCDFPHTAAVGIPAGGSVLQQLTDRPQVPTLSNPVCRLPRTTPGPTATASAERCMHTHAGPNVLNRTKMSDPNITHLLPPSVLSCPQPQRAFTLPYTVTVTIFPVTHTSSSSSKAHWEIRRESPSVKKQ